MVAINILVYNCRRQRYCMSRFRKIGLRSCWASWTTNISELAVPVTCISLDLLKYWCSKREFRNWRRRTASWKHSWCRV